MNGVAIEAGESSTDFEHPILDLYRWFSILDLILRIVAATGTLASAIAMGTNDETVLVVQQLIFRAEYDDLPAFKFFVIVNSIVCGYLVVLSLPLSIFHVIKAEVKVSRLILLIFDTALLALLSAGASAATAIVYLAHEGNASANWPAICQQFNSFCKSITGCLIGSFGAVILLFIIIVTSALAISRTPR